MACVNTDPSSTIVMFYLLAVCRKKEGGDQQGEKSE
jgi:hypothetical protein